ncbi:hypothetical protein C8R44DRAFT_868034 [Mycena epipterygia]|nr:hypothetical protein C8R44DRAFT_868034 [Mycena epipterygia]
MPLVLHSSSCCDVCLELYTWATPEDSPHAIPCGHIFCRTCLVSVEPTNCPLCRKAFNRERIKKLHVDRPEIDTESGFLQRVALAFDAQTDEQAQLSVDIEPWLDARPENDHVPLRKAWAAFKVYNKLNERRQLDKKTIKEVQRMLRHRTEESEYDRDTFKAVESSLLTQVSDLSSYVLLLLAASSLTCAVMFVSRQIADLEAQVNPLRLELSKYQHTKNPLPPPPEPVPLDRFPPFARATAESAEGYAAYFTPNGAPSWFPNNSPHTAEPEPPRTDKGKGKQPQYNIYQPAANQTGNVIIPGATPSQRVIPTDDGNGHAYHTHVPASAYVEGYANGYGLGYGAASGGVDADANYASTSAYQLPPQPRAEEPENFLEDAIGGLRLWGVPTASAAAIAPVAARPPDSAPVTLPLRRRRAYIAPSHHSTDDDASLTSSRPSALRPSALRRSTVQVDGHFDDMQAPSAWQPPPIYAAPPVRSDALVRFNTQAPDDGQRVANDFARRTERQRVNRQSYSSWGTVNTNSPVGTRGSMSEIGDLTSFPLIAPVEARMNSVGSLDEILDRGLMTTPRQDSRPPLGFTGAAPVRPGHAHRYSLPGNTFPSLEGLDTHDANSLQRSTGVNNRQRTAPRRFSQLSTGTSEFGAVPAAMPQEPPPIENALGLELGMEAAPSHTITAPTPRVQVAQFLRSFSGTD